MNILLFIILYLHGVVLALFIVASSGNDEVFDSKKNVLKLILSVLLYPAAAVLLARRWWKNLPDE